MNLELKTDRLILRPLNIDDIETVHSYASDVENTRYMIFLPNSTRDETSQFLKQVTEEWQKDIPSFYEFAITLDGIQIGAVSISLGKSELEGEMGWILNKKYWGVGYATEAALAVKNFAEKSLNVSKIVAHCDYRNIASCNVMRKIGLVLESDNGERIYPKTGEKAKELMYSLAL